MSSSDFLRRYVQPLADWARDGPASKSTPWNNPLREFIPWARELIKPYYWGSLNQHGGMTMPQFVDDCIERVFLWAKANAPMLLQPHFTDVKLEWRIRRIAKNLRVDLRRDIKANRLESLDNYSGQRWSRVPRLQATPVSLTILPGEAGFSNYPSLEDEFVLACEVMPRFNQRLRSKKKMRQLLALLHRLGRRLGRRRGFPGYWYVWRVLRRKKGHLPAFARGYLQARLPQVEYKVINSRLGFLRRAFANFLLTL